MHDIFISYSHQDHERVAKLATALQAQGYSVWWDRELLPSQDYAAIIETALNDSRCILTVWSPKSVTSKWVRAESGRGFNLDKIVPVLIEDANIPIPFDSIHTADLRNWQGDVGDKGFVELLKALAWRMDSKDEGEEAIPTATESKRKKNPGHETQSSRISWVLGIGLLLGVGAGTYFILEPTGQDKDLLKQSCEKVNDNDRTEMSIIKAAKNGKIKRVRQCLKAGVDVNIKDHNKWNALHAAARYGSKEIAELLVDNNIEINAVAAYNYTPLDVAHEDYQKQHKEKHKEVVDYLESIKAIRKRTD